LLTDACRPLFDRTVQMALPPGSVFKVVSAAALLDSGVSPTTPVNCEGYLHQPEALRCAIFRHLGIGHGPVTMVDALARSCNVYFFHYAEQIGSAPLIDWGQRFGLGQISGIDLPGEVRGSFPVVDSQVGRLPENGVATGSAATKSDPRQIAIGQGPVTVTPLQIARVFAVIANGGCLVRPHIVQQMGTQSDPNHAVHVQPPEPILGLSEQKLQVIQKGLRQAVANTEGTAHATVDVDEVAIAGKTGTAEVGGHRAEHSWFAGYAPADQPEVAIVVVLEHAGEAATSAGPVVQRLVMQMNELGYFSNSKSADRRR
jgi:penicillin-binding protein 2